MPHFRHPEPAFSRTSSDDRRLHLALVAILINVGMANLDAAMTSTALPAIARSLGASDADSIWVISAYQIALVATLLPAAALGEIIGLRRVTMAGLVLFTLAAAACVTAPGFQWLVAARVLQGMSAACILGLSLALMRSVGPDGRLGSSMGLNALVVGASLAAGPALTSLLVAAGWRWLYIIDISGGLVAIAMGFLHLPPTARGNWRFDFAAAGLCAAMLAAVVYGLNAAAHGAVGPVTGLSLLIGGIAFLGLLKRQRGSAAPMLAFDLLRQPAFALSGLVAFFAASTQTLALVALPFMLQKDFSFSQAETGLLITPWPALVALTAPLAGRLSDRIAASLLCGLGLLIAACGILLFLSVGEAPTMFEVAWHLGLCGLGFGLFQSPNMRTLLITGPVERSGRAGGVSSVINNLGQASGTALVAALFATRGDQGALLALYFGACFCAFSALLNLVRWSKGAVLTR
jgi:DHA2 family multidrug resistance protein-like MFS transporter